MDKTNLNDNWIELTDDDGNKYLFEILFTFDSDETGNTYAFVYDPHNPEEVIMMKYDENGDIHEVLDENELSMGEEVLNFYMDHDDSVDEEK